MAKRITEEMKIKISHKVKMKCKENVVGALYRDSKDTIYSFSKKGEYIQLNPLVYQFMTKHKKILEKMNYFDGNSKFFYVIAGITGIITVVTFIIGKKGE